MPLRFVALVALACAVVPLAASTAMAQGTLNLYCSVQVEWCQAIATNFQRDTGIRVNMT
jgi:iron(III) transport system substrate-binding protein